MLKKINLYFYNFKKINLYFNFIKNIKKKNIYYSIMRYRRYNLYNIYNIKLFEKKIIENYLSIVLILKNNIKY